MTDHRAGNILEPLSREQLIALYRGVADRLDATGDPNNFAPRLREWADEYEAEAADAK